MICPICNQESDIPHDYHSVEEPIEFKISNLRVPYIKITDKEILTMVHSAKLLDFLKPYIVVK